MKIPLLPYTDRYWGPVLSCTKDNRISVNSNGGYSVELTYPSQYNVKNTVKALLSDTSITGKL